VSEQKVYYFAKDKLQYYADTTEPDLYPHLYEEMVTKSEFDKLQNRFNRLNKVLIGINDLLAPELLKRMRNREVGDGCM